VSTALDGSRDGTGGISTRPAPSLPRDDRALPRRDLDRVLRPAEPEEPDQPEVPEGWEPLTDPEGPEGPEPEAGGAAGAAASPQVLQ
jgi:hypothetical protein